MILWKKEWHELGGRENVWKFVRALHLSSGLTFIGLVDVTKHISGKGMIVRVRWHSMVWTLTSER